MRDVGAAVRYPYVDFPRFGVVIWYALGPAWLADFGKLARFGANNCRRLGGRSGEYVRGLHTEGAFDSLALESLSVQSFLIFSFAVL